MIAINDNHVLVLEKNQKTKKYSLPGGVKKKNESIEESLIRETYEEVGILLDKSKTDFFYRIKVVKEDVNLLKSYFVVQDPGFKIQNKEPLKFKSATWVPWYKAGAYMDKTDKIIVEKYFTYMYQLN